MGYYRKIIRITAHDSPNVRLGLLQESLGIEPSGESILDGVLSWQEFQRRLVTWDDIQQMIGLWAQFPEDATILLFPNEWIARAENKGEALRWEFRSRLRVGRAIGIDPAEGGDRTAMACVDDMGLIDITSRKTPNTADVTNEALAFMRQYGVKPENMVFDRGGGGKEHADRLRSMGYPVRTVGFGDSIVPDPKRGLTRMEDRLDNREEKYACRNRRALMYWDLSCLLDPSLNPKGFGICFAGEAGARLKHQLPFFYKLYDEEGRLYLPPKNRIEANSSKKSLSDMIGHSPDEADALVLAVHGMKYKTARSVAGAV